MKVLTVARIEHSKEAAIAAIERTRKAGQVWDGQALVKGRVVGETIVERRVSDWRAEADFEVTE